MMNSSPNERSGHIEKYARQVSAKLLVVKKALLMNYLRLILAYHHTLYSNISARIIITRKIGDGSYILIY
jgi:hypothetical protein